MSGQTSGLAVHSPLPLQWPFGLAQYILVSWHFALVVQEMPPPVAAGGGVSVPMAGGGVLSVPAAGGVLSVAIGGGVLSVPVAGGVSCALSGAARAATSIP